VKKENVASVGKPRGGKRQCTQRRKIRNKRRRLKKKEI